MSRFACLIFTLLLALTVHASEVSAQVQTFFISPQQDEAAQVCATQFSATLVNFQTFRATQDASTQRSVSECLGAVAGSSSQRECALSMANIEVDSILRLRSTRLGEAWSWTVEALSPSQGGDQTWGGSDIAPGVTDRALAAYESCSYLAMKFACLQETNQGCVDAQAVEEGRRRAKAAVEVGSLPSPAASQGATPAAPSAVPAAAPSGRQLPDPRFSGWILVSGLLPANATISVDGEVLGTGDGEYAVVAGQKRVVFAAPGHEPAQKMVAVSVGAIETLENVTLKKVPSYLQTRAISPPEAAVLVDGNAVGVGVGRFEIAEGDHVVTITARGYETLQRKIRTAQGGTSIIEHITLERTVTRLTVGVSPETTITSIDGVTSITGSGTIPVSPGKHLIAFSAPGFSPSSETILFEMGVEVKMPTVTLHVTPATLRVTSDEDDTEVWIFRPIAGNLVPQLLGKVASDSTASFNAGPGTYLLSIGKQGFDPLAQRVTLVVGENPIINVELSKRTTHTFGFSLGLGAASSFLSEPFFDANNIAKANSISCEGGCDLSWDKEAVFAQTKRFEYRFTENEQLPGPSFTSYGSGLTLVAYIESRPEVTMSVTRAGGISMDPNTGEFVPVESAESRIPWSWTTIGMAIMTDRTGFGLDAGLGLGVDVCNFGDLTMESSLFFSPRIELFVPVTDTIGLNLQYEVSLAGMYVASETFDSMSVNKNDAPDPTISQRLGLGLDFGF